MPPGLEPETRVCQQASRRGQLALIAGRIEHAPFASRAFDVITLWHTLEHTASPRRALEEARRLLHAPAAIPESQVAGAPPAANGVLMLETPNVQSIQARFFGRYWFHLDAPRHRFHFTPATLEAYLRACGFREVRLRHLPSSVGITGSIQALFDRLTKRRSAGLRESRLLQALVWPLAALEALVGRGGCVQVSARATPAVMSDSGNAQPDHVPVALSVVIVSWNCWPHLRRCLESLRPAWPACHPRSSSWTIDSMTPQPRTSETSSRKHGSCRWKPMPASRRQPIAACRPVAERRSGC